MPPVFVKRPSGRLATAEFAMNAFLTLIPSSIMGIVYFTLDVSPSASVYTSPIALMEATRVKVRVWIRESC